MPEERRPAVRRDVERLDLVGIVGDAAGASRARDRDRSPPRSRPPRSPSTGCRAGAAAGSPRGRSWCCRPCGSACSVCSSVFSMPSRQRIDAGLAGRDAGCRRRARCRRRGSSRRAVTGTFSAISASRKARQAFFDDGRVLVGEVDQLDAVLAVQPGDLRGELHGIAMPPAGPEAALAAVVAQMRTAARELHDHGALAAPVAVARGGRSAPSRRGRRRGRRWSPAGRVAKGRRRSSRKAMPATLAERLAHLQRLDQRHDGLLAFAAHDDVD